MNTEELYQSGRYFDVGDIIEVLIEGETNPMQVEVIDYRPLGLGHLGITATSREGEKQNIWLGDCIDLRVIAYDWEELV